ncbi:MAG: hypothetical protein ACE5KC_01060 [Candidatus Bathyarchaeia archaeon]
MRADYGLYIVAVICFIVAGLVSLRTFPQYLPELTTFEGTAITVIFAASGLIFVILGYAARPKPIVSIPEAPKPAIQPSPPPAQQTAEEAMAIPSPAPTLPAPPQEEPAKPETEKPKAKTRRKKTRRRRKRT